MARTGDGQRFCELECEVNSFSYILTEISAWPYFCGSDAERPIPPWEIWPGENGLPDILGGVDHIIIARSSVATLWRSLAPSEFDCRPAFDLAGVTFMLLAPMVYLEPRAYELIDPLVVDGRVLMHDGALMTAPMRSFCARLRTAPNTIVFNPEAVANLSGSGYRFIPSGGGAWF